MGKIIQCETPLGLLCQSQKNIILNYICNPATATVRLLLEVHLYVERVVLLQDFVKLLLDVFRAEMKANLFDFFVNAKVHFEKCVRFENFSNYVGTYLCRELTEVIPGFQIPALLIPTSF